MSVINPQSSFQSWILTPEETLQGSMLSLLQKQCIQNQICQLAEEKLALTIDPDHFTTYIQREAELQGKIGSLQYLLVLSEEIEKATNQQTSHVQTQVG